MEQANVILTYYENEQGDVVSRSEGTIEKQMEASINYDESNEFSINDERDNKIIKKIKIGDFGCILLSKSLQLNQIVTAKVCLDDCLDSEVVSFHPKNDQEEEKLFNLINHFVDKSKLRLNVLGNLYYYYYK